MNILGKIPPADSATGKLSSFDWLKLLRLALMQALGAFVSVMLPALMGFKWIYKGTDYTVPMVALFGWLAETLRRILANNADPTPPPTPSEAMRMRD